MNSSTTDMMTPELPPNSWTISYIKPDALDVSWLEYKTIHHHEKLVLIANQLDLLNRFDNYHRSTCPEREAAKAALNAKKAELNRR